MTENDGTTLQEDLDNLSSWSEIWQLKFNAEKCKVMHIGHSYRTEYYMTEGILGKKKLESVQGERDLYRSHYQIRSDLKSVSQCKMSEATARREWSDDNSSNWIQRTSRSYIA